MIHKPISISERRDQAWKMLVVTCFALIGCGDGNSSPGGGGSTTTGGSTTNPSGGSAVVGGAGTNAGGGAATGGAAPGGTSTGGDSAATGGSDGGGVSSGGSSTAGSSGSGGGGSGGQSTGVIAGGVRWVGRVDVQDPDAPRFSWSASGFVGTVSGDTIAVKLRSEGDTQPVFFQPVIDGERQPRVSVATPEGEKTVTLGTGLGADDHLVELYRETEGKPGFATSTFLGFTSGTAKTPPAPSGRLIEVIGDSISAGYGNLGMEQHVNGAADPNGGCHFTTETESAYLAYGAVAARALGADVSILAGSGWGVYSDNGGNRDNVMPKIWERTLGSDAQSTWSFQVKPQAVVINLGTNDFSADMNLGSAQFSGAYTAFVARVRAQYPDAYIFCAVGPMLYGTGLANATAYIQSVVAEHNDQGDAKVKMLDFGAQDASQGTGCDWHPNVAENQRLAGKLVQALKTALGW